jgi:Protein of unknown function (DUF1800)
MQRILGQHLFNPPNVAGWPGGKYWIDSSSLTLRMKLPAALLLSEEINPKMNMQRLGVHHRVNVTFQQDEPLRIGKVDVDWTRYLEYWKKQPREQLQDEMVKYFFYIPVPPDQLKTVAENADKSSDEAYIKSLTMLLMQLPEYQLM